MGLGGQSHAPAALPAGKRPGAVCIGAWVGPRAKLDGYRKISIPAGFDPRTVHPVASRCTDCVIPVPKLIKDPYSENSTGSRHFFRCSTPSIGQILRCGTIGCFVSFACYSAVLGIFYRVCRGRG